VEKNRFEYFPPPPEDNPVSNYPINGFKILLDQIFSEAKANGQTLSREAAWREMTIRMRRLTPSDADTTVPDPATVEEVEELLNNAYEYAGAKSGEVPRKRGRPRSDETAQLALWLREQGLSHAEVAKQLGYSVAPGERERSKDRTRKLIAAAQKRVVLKHKK